MNTTSFRHKIPGTSQRRPPLLKPPGPTVRRSLEKSCASSVDTARLYPAPTLAISASMTGNLEDRAPGRTEGRGDHKHGDRFRGTPKDRVIRYPSQMAELHGYKLTWRQVTFEVPNNLSRSPKFQPFEGPKFQLKYFWPSQKKGYFTNLDFPEIAGDFMKFPLLNHHLGEIGRVRSL